ncbi:MAG: hypothetical protein ABWX90_03300 [Candidatus Saccharimonadales bacterium]
MFKVATAGGFLIRYDDTGQYDVHPDSRLATLFPSFMEADNHARKAVELLFGRMNQYWDILISTSTIPISAFIYADEIESAKTRKEVP